MVDVDTLIRDIAHGRLNPEGWHADLIREHVSAAPFSTQRIRTRARDRGLIYQGRSVQRHDDSAFVHLARRVVDNRQWAHGTTLREYLDDLHRVVSHPSASFVAYDAGRGAVVGVYGPNTIPPARLGPDSAPNIYLVYAADRQSIITGYQVTNLNSVRIPEEARWLT